MGMIRWGWAAALGVMLCATAAWAKDEPPAPATTTTAQAPATVAPAAAQASAQKAKEAEASARLSGTVWDVELTPMSGEKPKRPLKDVLRFEQGKVAADRLASDGYPASNYTLTVGTDGIPVWETMQTGEGKGVVFWRGELHGETMSGILSKHPVEGATDDYSFVGRPTAAVASQPKPVAAAQPAAAAQTEAAPAATSPESAPKKKKKGWW